MPSEDAVADRLEAQLLDLAAVIERLAIDRLALYATLASGPAAIAYAAHHPERVSRLILAHGIAQGSDIVGAPQMEGLMALLETDWEMFTETFVHVGMGWSAGEIAIRGAALMRERLTPERMRADLEAVSRLNVTDLLPQVRSPTLVLQRRQVSIPSVAVARGLAAGIPGAQLVLLDGTSPAPYVGDWEAMYAAMDEFLGEGEEAEPKSELPEGMAVLLFTDIANSTALTEQLGDAAFREKAGKLDTSLRSIIEESDGTPVEGKVLGDGVMAVFTSARQAIQCALGCNGAGESVGLQLHIGIHAGDVIREGNNVYGGAVNIAARIAGESEAGEVLVSDTVRSLARTSAGVSFNDRGEHTLKGIEEPQRLYAVREAD
jgi:class 3 adenylate cyclase